MKKKSHHGRLFRRVLPTLIGLTGPRLGVTGVGKISMGSGEVVSRNEDGKNRGGEGESAIDGTLTTSDDHADVASLSYHRREGARDYTEKRANTLTTGILGESPRGEKSGDAVTTYKDTWQRERT